MVTAATAVVVVGQDAYRQHYHGEGMVVDSEYDTPVPTYVRENTRQASGQRLKHLTPQYVSARLIGGRKSLWNKKDIA